MSNVEGEGKEGLANTDEKGKGKGRHTENTSAEDPIGAPSLMTSMMQSARSSVTPANLSSMLSGNGKVVPGTSSSVAQLPDYSYSAPLHRNGAQTSLASRLPPSGSSVQAGRITKNAIEDPYLRFADPAPSNGRFMAQTSSPAIVGPYSSAQSLDAALHTQVRAATSEWSEMNRVWQEAAAGASEEEISHAHNPAYHEAWASNIPAPSFSGYHDLRRGEHIDQLLQDVSLSDTTTPLPNVRHDDLRDFVGLLAEEEDREYASLSSTPFANGMSERQQQMHRALQDLQNSKERADERVRPPDDDPVARTGVYAASPTEALQAIWDGPGQGELASATIRPSPANAGTIMRKIRELLQRGSYVDDVYGIPPQLEKTIVAAEEPETEANKERRARAIDRLNALYRHLGAGPLPSGSLQDYVCNW